jgi:hypothetical protein
MSTKTKKEVKHKEFLQFFIQNKKTCESIVKIKALKGGFTKNQLVNKTTLGHAKAEEVITNLLSLGLLKQELGENKLYYIPVLDHKAVLENLRKVQVSFIMKQNELGIRIQMLKELISDFKNPEGYIHTKK